MDKPFEAVPDGVRLHIHLQPGAKRSAFSGTYGNRIKVAVQAPPIDGKANSALAALIAETLDIPLREVTLTCGTTSRDKSFFIRTAEPQPVLAKLENLIK